MRCAVFIQFFIATCSSVGILCLADAELDSRSNESAESLEFLRLEGRIVNGTKANLGQFPHQGPNMAPDQVPWRPVTLCRRGPKEAYELGPDWLPQQNPIEAMKQPYYCPRIISFISGYISSEVSLRRSTSNEHFCGGSVISDRWILSASHCMFKNGQLIWPWMVTVVAGQRLLRPDHPAGQRREVEAIILHPDFNYWTLANDVALLKLKRPLALNGPDVKAAKLQTVTVPPGTMCQVSGWGALKEKGSVSNDLMFVLLPIINPPRCKQLLVNVTRLPPGMFCAGYEEGLRDACQGDSGGPMMCRNFLSGIVSGGEGCARPELPGLYSNVAYYRPWIESQMNNYTTAPHEPDDWATIFFLEFFRSGSSSNVSSHLSFYALAIGYTLLTYLSLSPCCRL